jgi:hypothetical protein
MKSLIAAAALTGAAFGLGACGSTVNTEEVIDVPVGTPSIQEQACLSASAQQTGDPNVVVLGNEFSEANSIVTIGVGAAQTPYRCLVSNDGVVAELGPAPSL